MFHFDKLIEIMDRLRSPEGCPWDLKQTHQTLKPYLIEEAYEVLDAIDSRDDHALREELEGQPQREAVAAVSSGLCLPEARTQAGGRDHDRRRVGVLGPDLERGAAHGIPGASGQSHSPATTARILLRILLDHFARLLTKSMSR